MSGCEVPVRLQVVNLGSSKRGSEMVECRVYEAAVGVSACREAYESGGRKQSWILGLSGGATTPGFIF